MVVKDFLSQQVVAGWLLILSGIIFLPAGLFFTGRAILKWPTAQSQNYLYWERSLVMAAILLATLGWVLFERLLEAAGDGILAPLAVALFLIGAVLVIAAEAFGLSHQKYEYVPIVVFIILAFLGEAIFGASILLTGLLPGWAGWATIVWSLAWLVILPIARPQDMYYPWLFYVAPELIGILLLVGR